MEESRVAGPGDLPEWALRIMERDSECGELYRQAIAKEGEAARELARQAAHVFDALALEDDKSSAVAASGVRHKKVKRRTDGGQGPQAKSETILLGADGVLRTYGAGAPAGSDAELREWEVADNGYMVHPVEVARALLRAVADAHLLATFRAAVLRERHARADALVSRLPSEQELRISYRAGDRASHRLLALVYMYCHSGAGAGGNGWVQRNYGFLGMSEGEMRAAMASLTEQGYVSGRENDARLTDAGIAAAEHALSDPSQTSANLPALGEVLTSLEP